MTNAKHSSDDLPTAVGHTVLSGDGDGLRSDRGRGQGARHWIVQVQVGATQRLFAMFERERSEGGHLHVYRFRRASTRHAREVVYKGPGALRQLVATHLGHARISKRDVQGRFTFEPELDGNGCAKRTELDLADRQLR